VSALNAVLGTYAVHAGTAITFPAGSTVSGGFVGAATDPGSTFDLDELDSGVYIVGGDYDAGISPPLVDGDMLDAMAPFMGVVGLVPNMDVDIGGSTFTPGIWHSGTIAIAANLNVTLDGQGDVNHHACGCGRQYHPD
jgi:hypothetical protein